MNFGMKDNGVAGGANMQLVFFGLTLCSKGSGWFIGSFRVIHGRNYMKLKVELCEKELLQKSSQSLWKSQRSLG